ncbi:IS110 family transposase [Salinispora arenicola]|uniref:IS110 family transposase n=1 Tax=Salinispora arenicola TaxID=168697 RepID=UPI00036327B4|nr:IS110 family transposase [Salinispora arenicola]
MLFVGDDWAEDHHDVELQDETGRRLAKAKLPEGIAGVTRLHAIIGEHLSEDDDATQVVVGIETDRGPWVQALIAVGYQVYAINPLQVARYRERRSVSGGKSDTADAHTLADMVRADRHQLRPVAGDSDQSEAVKVVTRAHKTLIWEQTRHMLRLRSALREYFPAALAAFADLTAPEALELLAKAPEPASAARVPLTRILAAVKRARRHHAAVKAEAIRDALRADHLGQPPVVTTAYAAMVRAQVAILTTLNTEIKALQEQVRTHFGRHPDADIYVSQPGLSAVLGARVLAEFGDDKTRYASAKARKNYTGTSPITRQSGKRKVVLARHVHNNRLIDAVGLQALTAIRASPGARRYYDQLLARGVGHRAALRQLGNRLVGVLHGCLKNKTIYDEETAWPNLTERPEHAAA